MELKKLKLELELELMLSSKFPTTSRTYLYPSLTAISSTDLIRYVHINCALCVLVQLDIFSQST